MTGEIAFWVFVVIGGAIVAWDWWRDLPRDGGSDPDGGRP